MPTLPRKKVLILGSTGSIGTSALKVARAHPELMEIVGLAAHSSTDTLLQQAAETGVRHLALYHQPSAAKAASQLPAGVTLHAGPQGLIDLVQTCGADFILIAIVGTAGLAPALAAIDCGMTLAVASKEILVIAGEIITRAAHKKNLPILPVDSEHNAIFQCLQGQHDNPIRRLLLTASGGPFRTLPADQLPSVTKASALKHPTWEMGQKITIDSATLFNKGLEMIEAKWLFDVPMEKIEVVVHPQSIIHSMVEFEDRSVLAQLSHSDMCFPIQYAVSWPKRIASELQPLDFAKLASLTFEAPRHADFPALDLARQAGHSGGTLPAVLNAANEIAVAAFLRESISFPDIWKTVAHAMESHQIIQHPSLDEILEADHWARRIASQHLALPLPAALTP